MVSENKIEQGFSEVLSFFKKLIRTFFSLALHPSHFYIEERKATFVNAHIFSFIGCFLFSLCAHSWSQQSSYYYLTDLTGQLQNASVGSVISYSIFYFVILYAVSSIVPKTFFFKDASYKNASVLILYFVSWMCLCLCSGILLLLALTVLEENEVTYLHSYDFGVILFTTIWFCAVFAMPLLNTYKIFRVINVKRAVLKTLVVYSALVFTVFLFFRGSNTIYNVSKVEKKKTQLKVFQFRDNLHITIDSVDSDSIILWVDFVCYNPSTKPIFLDKKYIGTCNLRADYMHSETYTLEPRNNPESSFIEIQPGKYQAISACLLLSGKLWQDFREFYVSHRKDEDLKIEIEVYPIDILEHTDRDDLAFVKSSSSRFKINSLRYVSHGSKSTRLL